MKKRIKNIIVISSFILLGVNIPSETLAQEISERTIYLMRPKQFLGSGNSMNIHVNDSLIFKLRSGRRLIIKTDLNDTINFQIIYPVIKEFKSELFTFMPGENEKVYLEAHYLGGVRKFRVEVTHHSEQIGKLLFYNPNSYKDNEEEISKINNAP